MGSLLYYLPGAQRQTGEALRNGPLSAALRDCISTQALCDIHIAQAEVHGRGPDGGQGLIVSAIPHHGDSQQPIGMYASDQRWEDRGQFWIGEDSRYPVQPWDIQRLSVLDGHSVDCNGEEYTVPVIRRGGRFPAVPQSIGLDRDGRVRMSIRPAWRSAWDAAGEIWDRYMIALEPCEFSRVIDLCSQILGINYRVSLAEVSFLELVDTSNWEKIFGACVDWPIVEKMLAPDGGPEKNQEGGRAERASSSHGATAA